MIYKCNNTTTTKTIADTNDMIHTITAILITTIWILMMIKALMNLIITDDYHDNDNGDTNDNDHITN